MGEPVWSALAVLCVALAVVGEESGCVWVLGSYKSKTLPHLQVHVGSSAS
jgi:hypothetical protein